MDQKIRSEARRFNRTLAQIDCVYHQIALARGYSDSVMNILYTLADNDGACPLSVLVDQLGGSKQTVNSALRRLEAEGIVVEERAGGRSKRVRLTESGAAQVRTTVAPVIAVEDKIYSSWPREEWELYMSLTERYLQQLQQETKELREK